MKKMSNQKFVEAQVIEVFVVFMISLVVVVGTSNKKEK